MIDVLYPHVGMDSEAPMWYNGGLGRGPLGPEKLNYRKITMKYEEMTLEDLAHEMADIRKALDSASTEKANLGRQWDSLRKVHIPDKLDELGMDGARIKGVGTLSLATDAYCTTPVANSEPLKIWLTENGFESLIKPTVNASSLKAFMKEQILEGNPVPDEIVNFTPYTYAKITGAPK